MRGSVLVTFEEGKQSFGIPLYRIRINDVDTRDYQFGEGDNLYSTYIFSGDTISATISEMGYGEIGSINLFLKEYTNDNEGDNGIKTTFITGVTGSNTSANVSLLNVPINPSPNSYNFEVIVNMDIIQGCARIGVISGNDFVVSNTCEIKTKNVGLTSINDGSIYVSINRNETTTNVTYSGQTASGNIGSVFRLDKTYRLDPGFNSISSLGSSYRAINDIEIQNDGRVIVGGGQTSTTGFSLNRLTTTGALDPTFTRYTFDGGVESVTDVVQQSDGKIIASGNFTTISGLTYNKYARFNYDGTIDNTYYSGGISTGFKDSVNCEIDVRNDKVYYFGIGDFNGTSYGNILRLNTNGQLDTTFNGTGRGGFSRTTGTALVNSIKVLSNGKILCTGDFNRYNGQPCPNSVAVLNEDGTLDTTFNTGGTGLSTPVSIFIVQPTETLNEDENKYLIVGNFTGATYNGVSVPNDIFFLNLDGTLGDNSGLGTGIDGSPKTCKLLSNGNYLITGVIFSFNDISITNGGIIQLSSTGELQNC
jgi:uncharacterized delta-60 repeat protein